MRTIALPRTGRRALGLLRRSAAWLQVAVFAGFLLAGGPVTASATLQVVTTTPSLAALTRTVGGGAVQVRSLAPSNRDSHYLEARPSYMAAVRGADLLVEMGAGLEEGWLPAVVAGAANPRVNEGRPGRFRAADALHLIPSTTVNAPGAGHVHGEGNPHFNVDPLRMAELAPKLGERLAELIPDQAEGIRVRAREAAVRLREHAAQLATQVAPGQQFAAFHEDLAYLEAWLPVRVAAYLEPIPGVPPTARHLRRLVYQLQGRQGTVLYAVYQPSAAARYLERELGWTRYALVLEPPSEGHLDDYLLLMESWAAPFLGN